MTRTAGAFVAIFLSVTTTQSARAPRAQKWVTTWAASVHGPYPSGNPVAQPVLDRVFESPDRGAHDQTLRLIVRPSVWGAQVRLRFSNVFGTQAVTLDDVFAGLQGAGGSVMPGTNRRVTFNGGRKAVTLPPGQSAFSDPVALPFVTRASTRAAGWTQARRQLSRRWIVGADDLAREGAANLMCRRPEPEVMAQTNPTPRSRSAPRRGTSSTPWRPRCPTTRR